MLNLRTLSFFLLTAALFTSPDMAQPPAGVLKGVLTDDSGAVIPAAFISISGNGVRKAVQTQADGSYVISGLAPGQYALHVTYPGFAVFDKTVEVHAGAQEFPIQLTVTAEKQQVEVKADAGPQVSVEPDNNATALVIKGDDLAALPDDPDDLQDALQALAGPGAGPNGGSIYIDGFSGGNLPPKESIREIRVNQNPFSPEYDKLGYGRIEIFTKPGSDKFRGALFLHDGNGVLNSRNPFSANKPDYSSRMFDGNIGGPINKKSSFFLDYNRRDINDNAVIYAPNFIDPQTLRVTPIQQSVVTPNMRWSIAPRLDYQLTPGNALTVRFEEEKSNRQNVGIGGYSLPAPYASLGYNTNTDEQNLMLTETATLNTTMINETRFQFVRNSVASLGNNALPTISVAGAFTTGGNQTGNAYSLGHHYELQNNTWLTHGTHTVRWGVRLRQTDTAANSPGNFGGSFSFFGGLGPVLDASNQPVLDANGQPVMEHLLAVDQYYRTLLFQNLGYAPAQIRALGGGASRFTISGGNPYASISQFDAGPWVLDDWRVRPNLTLSLGLRYEIQTNVGDHGDVAPRIGIAWAPGGSGSGRQKTVIRGGFGIFYDRVSTSLILNTLRFNGLNEVSYVVNNPDFYPNVPPVSSLTPTQNSIYRLDPNYRAAASMQGAIGVERQLPRNTTVALTYTYTRANHLEQVVPVNTPIPGTYPLGQPSLGLFPYGGAGNIFQYESGGFMKQNLVMANFNTRFSRYVSLFGNYTLNYARDLPNDPTDPYNFLLDWGRSSLDRRHRLLFMGSITAPLGFQLNPMVIMQSGSPYDVLLGTDLYGDTFVNARPAFAADPNSSTAVCREPYGCFTAPVPGSAANLVPRNYLTMAGMISMNLRLSRTFGFGKPSSAGGTAGGGGWGGGPHGGGRDGGGMRMGPPPGRGGGMFGGASAEHRYNVTLGVMAANILNHFNPGGYQGNINSPQFGQPTSVNTGFGGGPGGFNGSVANNRRLEFQVRFSF